MASSPLGNSSAASALSSASAAAASASAAAPCASSSASHPSACTAAASLRYRSASEASCAVIAPVYAPPPLKELSTSSEVGKSLEDAEDSAAAASASRSDLSLLAIWAICARVALAAKADLPADLEARRVSWAKRRTSSLRLRRTTSTSRKSLSALVVACCLSCFAKPFHGSRASDPLNWPAALSPCPDPPPELLLAPCPPCALAAGVTALLESASSSSSSPASRSPDAELKPLKLP
mmetsp:Transcript_2848/g.6359  ORF Transcript_2848/g.6359 Transcript_2848/m.6359 type:complete len:237 (-) Transcript_2848:56-766(-)